MGLPKKVVNTYKTLAKDEEYFAFDGFISTLLTRSYALEFAFQAFEEANGLMPVLFEFITNYDEGNFKAYLHDSNLSSYPEEKEVLLGTNTWFITEIF